MLNPALVLFSGSLNASGAQASLDISGLTTDFTVCLEIDNLSAASGIPTLIISLEDSVNAFTALLTQKVLANIVGPISSTPGVSPETFRFRKLTDLANMRAGVTNGVARVNLTLLGGTTPNFTGRIWIE